MASSRRLAALVDAGWLTRVRRGVYALRPLEAAADTPVAEEDPWVVASRVFAPCYIGGWPAAGHWHLTEQLYRSTLVVSERRVRRADITVGSSAYHVVRDVRASDDGLTVAWRANARVRVSSVERTVIDGCAHPNWLGGGRELVSIFRAAVADGRLDASALIESARVATGAALARLAVLVERYWPTAIVVTEFAARNRGQGYARFDPSIRARGRLNTRWGVWMNVALGEDES